MSTSQNDLRLIKYELGAEIEYDHRDCEIEVFSIVLKTSQTTPKLCGICSGGNSCAEALDPPALKYLVRDLAMSVINEV